MQGRSQTGFKQLIRGGWEGHECLKVELLVHMSKASPLTGRKLPRKGLSDPCDFQEAPPITRTHSIQRMGTNQCGSPSRTPHIGLCRYMVAWALMPLHDANKHGPYMSMRTPSAVVKFAWKDPTLPGWHATRESQDLC